MRRLFAALSFCAAFCAASSAWAQATQQPPPTPPKPNPATQPAAPKPPPAQTTTDEGGPETTTIFGDTGLWFVPTGRVLRHKQWSGSLYRVNYDDGQGFTDISNWPVTFAVGLGDRAEFFGNWVLVTRIDRDTRPLFFHSTSGEQDTGTGGGIVPNYPKVRTQWTGNKLGDIWLGGKLNFLQRESTAAAGVRGMVKLPVGDDGDGASSGSADFIIDGIFSKRTSALEFGGYGGFMVRGSPDGYELTNGFRWGLGAGFPQKAVRVTAELFGESYFDDQITSPGDLGEDGSFVPATTFIKSPVIFALGVTFQASNGFFIGAGASMNLTMAGRSEATPGCPGGGIACTPVFGTFEDESGDAGGWQVRIGFHPGGRRVAPPPPPPVVTPTPEPKPLPPANRPPTVKAACDPCTVEVGRVSTVSATAQDPDGDALTCFWQAKAGNLTNATAMSTPWTAPQQVGVVPITITCNDGKGGVASDTVNINVIAPAKKTYTFEDVHFDFDRYTLRPDALKILDEAVTAMQADSSLRLVIEGHTCNIGTAEYNLALGERRAGAVRDYLASRGIGADRLRTVSYGEERPKYDNSREETRRLNRRAALTVDLRSVNDPDWQDR